MPKSDKLLIEFESKQDLHEAARATKFSINLYERLLYGPLADHNKANEILGRINSLKRILISMEQVLGYPILLPDKSDH